MRIANPLYDNAFKYLMSNDRLARKVLSVILEKEVIELELAQQEHIIEGEAGRFTMYRLDFKAVIEDADGRKETVLIELQKSKLPTNIERFRNYLGFAYVQKKRSRKATVPLLPIITIYILGYNIEDIPAVAVKIKSCIFDMTSQEEMYIKSDFIGLLTHSSYVLQVKRLPEQRRSRIEQFLTLFNQAWVMEHKYIIDLKEVPEEFQDIADYLRRPLLDEDLLAQLLVEEEVETLLALQESERIELQETKEELSVARVRIQEARARAEQESARAEQESARAEQESARAFDNAMKLARFMRQSGMSDSEIIKETGLSDEHLKGI